MTDKKRSEVHTLQVLLKTSMAKYCFYYFTSKYISSIQPHNSKWIKQSTLKTKQTISVLNLTLAVLCKSKTVTIILSDVLKVWNTSQPKSW